MAINKPSASIRGEDTTRLINHLRSVLIAVYEDHGGAEAKIEQLFIGRCRNCFAPAPCPCTRDD